MTKKNKLPEIAVIYQTRRRLSKKQVSYYQELINALKQLNKGEIKIYDK